MAKIPLFKSRGRGKKKLALPALQPPKKTTKPTRPSRKMGTDEVHKAGPKEELHRGLAKGLASGAAAISGTGPASSVLKAGLAGAAAGAEIEASYHRYKARVKKAKAKAAKTTVSQSAMSQKRQFHKKDKTSTEGY